MEKEEVDEEDATRLETTEVHVDVPDNQFPSSVVLGVLSALPP